MPESVALVGASSKPGSIGRIVMENLLAGVFRGPVFAVNPAHRRVLARRAHASVAAIGKPVDLALIAVPYAAVPAVLEDSGRAGVKAAVVLSAPPTARTSCCAGSRISWPSRRRAASACSVRIRSA